MWRRMPLDALQQAAEAGTPAAQAALGFACMHCIHGVTKDGAACLRWLRKAAAGGMLPPRVHLAHPPFVLAKLATAPAASLALLAEAADWARPAAEAGDETAQRIMFDLLRCSRKFAVDEAAAATAAEAAQWLRLAAA